jgi:hypothetical protein
MDDHYSDRSDGSTEKFQELLVVDPAINEK